MSSSDPHSARSSSGRESQAVRRKRTETPPPKAKSLFDWRDSLIKEKEAKEAAEKAAKAAEFKKEVFRFLAGTGVACASVFAVKMYLDKDGDGHIDKQYVVHRHADGSPDWAFGDTGAVCYKSGEAMSSVVTFPVYYSGMMAYTILYLIGMMVYTILTPLIWIASKIIAGSSWMMSCLTYPLTPFYRMMVWMQGIYLKVCLWLVSWPYRFIAFIAAPLLRLGWWWLALCYWVMCIPKNIMLFLRVDRVIAGLVALIKLYLVAVFFKTHRNMRAVACTFLAILAGIAYNHGTDVMTYILMHIVVCPAQLTTGIVSGVEEALGYWTAIVTFTKMS